MANVMNKLSDPRFLRRLLWLVVSLAIMTTALLGIWWQRAAGYPLAARGRSLAWLWHPLERNPILGLAFSLNGSITSGAEGRIGWVVGDAGMILKTENGGDTWEQRPSGTTANLYSVTFTSDDTGWAVGLVGTVVTTENGGDTWEQRPSGTTANLYSVTFTSDDTGWAVGLVGTVVTTENGGDTWEQRPSGTTANLYSVTFTSDDTGWAVGDDGTVVTTENGGDTWEQRPSGTTANLYSVTFTSDDTGWAVGDDGTILKTENGGDTWEQRPSGTTANLYSVTFTSDDTGWAVGDDGTILKTENGGDTWEQSPSGTTANLYSVTFTANGTTGWAGGANTILMAADRGESWRLLNFDDDYRKSPAPWTGIALVLAFLPMWFVFRPLEPTNPRIGIADELASDRPIDTEKQDKLRHVPRAKALSSLLRNENTEPPLTIAVTGEWGEGKTSLMNLVKDDLEQNGRKAVWFNAWHHQKELHLFAAVLQAVREQIVPRWWTYSGLRFRVRLVLPRALRHLFWTGVALLFFGLSAGVLVLILFSTDLDWIVDAIKSVPLLNQLPNIDNTADRIWTKSVPPLVTLVISVFIAFRPGLVALKRSGLNPGRLMAVASGAVRVKAFEDQLSFRYRFGEAFKEVAQALKPYTPLILIDDLDRCRPEQIVETLEAIDFLVNAGPCFIVMGYWPERVISCVGLEFREVAETEGRNPSDYARQYLEKLINIEVSTPKLTNRGAAAIIQRTASDDRKLIHNRRGGLRAVTIVPICVVTLALGFLVPWWLSVLDWSRSLPPIDRDSFGVTVSMNPRQGSSENYAVVLDPQPTDSVTVVVRRASGGDADLTVSVDSSPALPAVDPIGPQSSTDSVNSTTTVTNPASDSHVDIRSRSGNGPDVRSGYRPAVSWWYLILAGACVVVSGVAVGSHLWRREKDQTKDSEAFKAALNIWHPVALATTNLPRQAKRFVNRVRYLAMLSRFSWSGDEEQSPNEPLIVALAALQALNDGTLAENRKDSLPVSLVSVFNEQDDRHANDEFDAWVSRTLERLVRARLPEDRDVFCNKISADLRKAFEEHHATFIENIEKAGESKKVTEKEIGRLWEMAQGMASR